MKLFCITLRNFRNFEEYKVPFGKKVTVLIGRNGMGKTNVIAGVVQLLSFVFSKQRDTLQYDFIRSTDQSVKSFLSTDPRYSDGDYTYPLSLEAHGGIRYGSEMLPLDWTFEQEGMKSGLRDSKFRLAYHTFWEHYNTSNEKPVFAYFSDGFPHKDTNIGSAMKEKLRSGNALPAGDGYYQWDKEQSCVNIWKKYFVQQWVNNKFSPNPEMESFVETINGKLREFSSAMEDGTNSIENPLIELSVDYREGEATLLAVFLDGTKIPFSSLPAGYERIYSMVLDMACRAYLLNGSVNPEGVVLIDEIDLHLHPSLAAEILSRFQRSFPKIQFIVSTHSPMVVCNFDQNAGGAGDYILLNLLRNEDCFYNKVVDNGYGLDYNSGLENVMGTMRHQRFNDDLAQAYRYWQERDMEKAKRIADLLLAKYGRESSVIKTLGL